MAKAKVFEPVGEAVGHLVEAELLLEEDTDRDKVDSLAVAEEDTLLAVDNHRAVEDFVAAAFCSSLTKCK